MTTLLGWSFNMALTLPEIREQYPQYADKSDAELANAMYNKFAAGKIDRANFDKQIGYTPESPLKEPNVIDAAIGIIKRLGTPAAGIADAALTGIAKGTYDSINQLGDQVMNSPLSPVAYANKMAGNPASAKSAAIFDFLKPADSLIQGRKNNFIEGLIEDAAKMAPEMLIGRKLLRGSVIEGLPSSSLRKATITGAKYGTEGAAYADKEGENPLLIGGVAAIAPPALNIASKGINKAIINGVAPRLLEKEFSMIESPESVMEIAEGALRGKFSTQMKKYRELNEQSEKFAKLADEKKIPYNNKSYIDELKRIYELDKTKFGGTELGQIQTLIDNAPKTFEEALSARKLINDMNLGSNSFEARQALIKNVEENVASHGGEESKDFANSWRMANQHYAQKVSPFYKNHDAYGNLRDNNLLRKSLLNEEDAQGNLLNIYTPKGQRVDTNNLKHLSTILEDPQIAKDAVKAAYFKDAFLPTSTGSHVPTKSFLTRYSKLSDNQKHASFTQDEVKILDKLSTINYLQKDESSFKKLAKMILGGAAGEAIGSALGAPVIGGAAGAAMGRQAVDMVGDVLLSPFVNKKTFINLLEKAE